MKPVKSINKLASRWKVKPKVIKKQVTLGKKEEMEHTNKPKVAEKYAKQHELVRPKYYTDLKKMENKPVVISGREDWKKNGRKG
jgi:hypothetical protein